MTDVQFSPSPGTCYDQATYMQKRCDECSFIKNHSDTMKCPYLGWDQKKISEYYTDLKKSK